MAIDRKRLAIFARPDNYDELEPPTPVLPVVPEAGRPELWGVVYGEPNHNGERKNCLNCVFWATSQQCALHAPEVYISAAAVCGYHVPGSPSNTRPDLPGLEPLKPMLSGLSVVPAGTSCDSCRWYEVKEVDSGDCHAVDTPDGMPASVSALGCCARWEWRQG